MDLPNHHAIFVEGEIPSTYHFVVNNLENKNINVSGNPDVVVFDFDVLGIEEARKLIDASLSSPLKELKKKIIIKFQNITREAQNALLKLFEDPNPKSEFIILSTNADALLSTLKSRLFVIREEANIDKSIATEFLKLQTSEMIKESERLIKESKENGSKQAIINLLLSIHESLKEDPKKNARALKAISLSLDYIADRSASLKILLESVILAL